MYVSQRIRQGKFWFFVNLYLKQKRRGLFLRLAGVKDQSSEYAINNPAANKEGIVNEFHKLYYNNKDLTHYNTYWLGTKVFKCPLDLWIYQEIIIEIKPDLIVETGTNRGGSALFMAHLLDAIKQGEIITIDIIPQPDLPVHPRIQYFVADSTASETYAYLSSHIKSLEEKLDRFPVVMVILDSNHAQDHVLKEMTVLGKLVTEGSYMIVEDGNLNGHPVWPEFGPGPFEAINEFLKLDTDFEVDKEKEKFFLSFNPCGYLRKIKKES